MTMMELPQQPVDFSELPDVSECNPELTEPGEIEYAAHMKARDDYLRHVFGQSHPNGDILAPSDPNLFINWAGGGVYQYCPGDGRTGWHYVTHGLSQPLGGEEEDLPLEERYSGLGIELVISSPCECGWAPDVLLNLVRYLLFNENARVILPGDRIPCGGPIVLDSDSQITHIIVTLSREYQHEVLLPAGLCTLVHMLGVTDGEIERAVEWGLGQGGSHILAAVLDKLEVGVLTDPDRTCLRSHPDFESLWQDAEKRFEAEWRSQGWDGEGKK